MGTTDHIEQMGVEECIHSNEVVMIYLQEGDLLPYMEGMVWWSKMRMSRCNSSKLRRTKSWLSTKWDLRSQRKPLWGLDNLLWKEIIGGGKLRLIRKLLCRNFSNSRRKWCECVVGSHGKPFLSLGTPFSMLSCSLSNWRTISR